MLLKLYIKLYKVFCVYTCNDVSIFFLCSNYETNTSSTYLYLWYLLFITTHFSTDFVARCAHRSVQWRSQSVQFSGCPFVVVGRSYMDCRHGPQRHAKKTITSEVCIAIDKYYLIGQFLSNLQLLLS